MNLAKLYDEQICPACGYKLDFTPWVNGVAREKPCQCCGLHFGYDDRDQSEAAYLRWRQHWTSTGRRWWGRGPQPPDYDPADQLAKLEHIEETPPS